MNRLTIDYDGNYVPKKLCTIDRDGGADDCDDCKTYCVSIEEQCDKCAIQECFDKLAAYENTGFDPENIRTRLGQTESIEKVEKLKEYVCDELCKYSEQAYSQEDLEEYCADCRLSVREVR